MLNDPILMLPDFAKHFILHISTSKVALSGVLMQEDSSHIECTVYLVSKALVGYKFNYLELDYQCPAIVHATKRPMHYMLHNHTTMMLPSKPLKYILDKTTLSRCYG